MAHQPRNGLGGMRQRLIIETPVEAATLLGGALITWQPGAAIWGRIEARTGRETLDGLRLEGRVETRITLRFRDGLMPGQRLRAGARLFSIRAVFDPDGEKRRLIVQAEEITA